MTAVVSKERTRNYLRQIKGAVVYKAVAMAASFLAIPLMIHYLGQEQFGVWSTLLTVMSWIVFFDLGIGNGLRNKVAESLAKSETVEAATYVGSAYTLLGLIALTLWLVLTIAAYWIPWQTVFNTLAVPEATLRETIQITAFFIVLNFWVALIAALLGAVQRTSLIALGQLISNTLVLALVFFLSRATEASISSLALAYGISLVTANIALSVWFYRTRPELRPRLYLDKSHISPLLGIGLQFFVIQLAVLVIFTTDKILITQLFGPEYVTQYEVVFKLFSVITFGHALISAPLWSAYTDAYHRDDNFWIRRMLRSQKIIFLGVLLATGLLAIIASPIIRVWIADDFTTPNQLIIATSLFVLVSTWNNIYAIFLNGIGKIKIQLYTAIIAMTANIPLSIFLAKNTELGTSAIVVGTTCCLLIAAVALPIQVHYLTRPVKYFARPNAKS
jgi:O-antigen/teichoic acid export membrane protein